MVRDLRQRIAAISNTPSALLDALIESGQLEAALADLHHPASDIAAELTDALAALGCGIGRAQPSNLLELTERIHPPETLAFSPPEGFTYYALHPLDFANVVENIEEQPKLCAVIGIRSIGTTLSAMTTAALWGQGREASRITVRPTGHPYSRTVEFSATEKSWIRRQATRGAQFLIVDEGPGRSGSTFLSVGEAVCREGIDRTRITFLASRQVDPETLCADEGAERWRTFHSIATAPSVSSRFHDHLYAGGGEWRKLFYSDERIWPASWTQMERLKFLSPDRKVLFKFEGSGPIGAEVRERAFILAKAGFSPAAFEGGDGFLGYEFLTGKCMEPTDLTSSVLDRIAQYLGFRAFEFRMSSQPSSDLRTMTEFNIMQEFGTEVSLSDIATAPSSAVLADGRMQPFEWIAGENLLKTDSIDHGDNHFFPGPCDIAWDVAGTAIEWQMDGEGIRYLVRKLKQASGLDVSQQLSAYMLAYSVFRLGFCKMALSTVAGTDEESRLRIAYAWHRNQASNMLKLFAPTEIRAA